MIEFDFGSALTLLKYLKHANHKYFYYGSLQSNIK